MVSCRLCYCAKIPRMTRYASTPRGTQNLRTSERPPTLHPPSPPIVVKSMFLPIADTSGGSSTFPSGSAFRFVREVAPAAGDRAGYHSASSAHCRVRAVVVPPPFGDEAAHTASWSAATPAVLCQGEGRPSIFSVHHFCSSTVSVARPPPTKSPANCRYVPKYTCPKGLPIS